MRGKNNVEPDDTTSQLTPPARPRQNSDFPESPSEDGKPTHRSDPMALLWVQKGRNGSDQQRLGRAPLENVSGVKNAISVSEL